VVVSFESTDDKFFEIGTFVVSWYSIIDLA